MASPAPEVPDPSPAAWLTVAKAVGLLTVIISVLLVAFAWPAARSSVHDIPVAVAGPAAAVDQVTAALDQRLPDGFLITKVSDAADAERLIRDREVYGAIDVGTGGPRVLIASGGSPSVAQALQSIAAALSRRPTDSSPVAVQDVAALPSDDTRGAGLAAGSLPLVLGGMIAAVLLTRLVRGRLRRTVGAFAYSVTGGLAMAAILQFSLGSLDGHYLANAGAVALTIAATSLTILGCESLFGYLGFSIGAVAMLVIGNPLSAATRRRCASPALHRILRRPRHRRLRPRPARLARLRRRPEPDRPPPLPPRHPARAHRRKRGRAGRSCQKPDLIWGFSMKT